MSDLEVFVGRMRPSEESLAQYQRQRAEQSTILSGPTFTYQVKVFAERPDMSPLTWLSSCTFCYVVGLLESSSLDSLGARERRLAHLDWFSSEDRALALRKRGVTARQYAQALVKHGNIIKAEDSFFGESPESREADSEADDQSRSKSMPKSATKKYPMKVVGDLVNIEPDRVLALVEELGWHGRPIYEAVTEYQRRSRVEDGLEEDVDEAEAKAQAQADKPTNPSQSIVLGISVEGMAEQDALAMQAKLQARFDQQGIKATVTMMQDAPVLDGAEQEQAAELVEPTEEKRIEQTIRVLGELEADEAKGQVIGVECNRCHQLQWFRNMYAVRRDEGGRLQSTLSINNDLVEHQVQSVKEATSIMSMYAHCSECVKAMHHPSGMSRD